MNDAYGLLSARGGLIFGHIPPLGRATRGPVSTSNQRTKAALAAAKARGIKLGINGARIAAQHHRDAVTYAATMAGHVEAARASGRQEPRR